MTKQIEATLTSNRGKVYPQTAAVFDSPHGSVHGNEFGKYDNPATPERILCRIIILLSVILLFVTG